MHMANAYNSKVDRLHSFTHVFAVSTLGMLTSLEIFSRARELNFLEVEY